MPRSSTCFDRRIAARQGVADDDQVGRGVEVRRIITFAQRDALGLELRAHGRIDLGVRTGHAVPERTRQHGHTAHERPADTENMNTH